jgi:hypothetical protein
MLISPLLAVVVGLSGAGSITAPASAPIRVTACSIDPEYSYPNGGDSPIRTLVARYLDIKFINVTRITISAVAFTIKDGASTKTIVDDGTFSPGVTIAHTFYSPFRNNNKVVCRVSATDFNDGGMWMMRNAP